LIRFYSWHIYVLSLVCGIVMVWHLFRVRRDGGIAAAPVAERENRTRITRVDLLKREVLGMLVGGVVLLLLSIFMPAPIASPIRSNTILNADASAPWFFLWVQQLLKSGDPFLLGVLLPLAVIIFIGVMPYIFKDIKQNEIGHWFPRSGSIVQLLFIIIAVIIMTLTMLSIVKTL
jgi:quinol-cytochrome oxidoreductase complex cytochrome b subunit